LSTISGVSAGDVRGSKPLGDNINVLFAHPPINNFNLLTSGNKSILGVNTRFTPIDRMRRLI